MAEEKEIVRDRKPIKFSGKIVALAVTLTLIASLVVYNEFRSGGSSKDADTITLYGFSVKGEVFDGSIIPAFKEYWKDKTGKDVKFDTYYAGSGKITKQVVAGAPAEIMILSTEWDALMLKNEGLVTTDWTTFSEKGTVSKSPWVILTREGNPKGIQDFQDLTADGIEIVHADPETSGGACWSIFSMYGSELKRAEVTGGDGDAEGRLLVDGVVDNVISWQSSAREALSQFELGYGDAFITYENEAMLATSSGGKYDIVYPNSTIYSEHKVVLVDANIGDDEREVMEAFVEFLYTQEVQEEMADYGFRSVDDAINAQHSEFPTIQTPFTVDYLDGWVEAHAYIIEEVYAEAREG